MWSEDTGLVGLVGSVGGQAPGGGDNVQYVRDDRRLEGWSVGDVTVQGCHADDRTVKILEELFRDEGCHFRSDTSGLVVLVENQDLARFLHCCRDRRAIERRDGPEIENLDRDASASRVVAASSASWTPTP